LRSSTSVETYNDLKGHAIGGCLGTNRPYRLLKKKPA